MLGALETNTAALPVIPKLEPIPAEPQDLKLLVEEVNGLALRLRQAIRVGEDAAGLLSATRCVLRLLLEGPKTVPQLARIRGTSRQNVQIQVNRLQREGLLAFVSNPAHRRSALVSLTQDGQDVMASAVRAEQNFADGLSLQVSQSEVRTVVELLRRLRESIAERPLTPTATAASASPHKPVRAARESRANNPAASSAAARESSISPHELPVSLL